MKFLLLMQNYKINSLENLEITELDNDYELVNTITADKANIEDKMWILTKVKIYSKDKKTELFNNYEYLSSFNEK